MATEKTYINALITSLFMFLMITSGYPGLTIILNYLLLIIFIYFIVKLIKNKNKKDILKFIKLNVVLFLSVIILSTVIIVTLSQVWPYIQRFQGMSLNASLYLPLSPQSLLSLLIPFSVIKDTNFFSTDISMTNIYMGMFLLIFFIYSLFRKKKAIEKIFLYFGVFALLASFGEYLPVRKFLYNYIPFMNLFHFPSFFRIFTIITFLVIAGIHLSNFTNQVKIYKKLIFKIALSFSIILVCFIIYSLFHISFREFSFLESDKDFFELLKNSTIYEHIFIHSIIQFILLTLLIIFLIRSVKRTYFIKAITTLIIVEMIIAVQLNIYYTGVSEAKPYKMRKDLAQLPKGFPVPANNKIINNSDMAASFWPFWRNTNIFRKTISYDGFSSFVLNPYNYLSDNAPHLKNATLNNPLLFLSDKLYPLSKLPEELDPETDNKNIYINNEIYNKYANTHFKHLKNDTVFITSFSPNQVTVTAKCENTQIITLLQSNYPGWEVYIDNKLVPHFTSNYLFISSIIPKGEHIIKFNYSNTSVIIGFIISYIFFVLIILLLGIIYIKKDIRKRWYVIPVVLLLLIIGIFYTIRKRASYRFQVSGIYKELAEQTLTWNKHYGKDKIERFFNIDNPNYIYSYLSNSDNKLDFHQYRFKEQEDLAGFIDIVENSSTQYFLYGWSNLNNPPEVYEIIRMKYPRILEQYNYKKASITLFSKDENYQRTSLYSNYNDFEAEYPNWSGDLSTYDTTIAFQGQRSFKLDSITIYSSTFSAKYADITDTGNCLINIITDAYLTDNATAELVLETVRNGKTNQWFSSSLHKFCSKPYSWNKVILTKLIKSDLLPDDIIKVYVWNAGKKDVYIDNLRIEVYPVE